MKHCLLSAVIGAVIVVTGGCSLAYVFESDYLAACRKGAVARLEVLVSDDAGHPVPDASVKVLMGMNFRVNAYKINGETDGDGRFVIEGKTTGDEILIDVDKDGWYGSSRKLCFVRMGAEHEVRNGRWQPDGMRVPIIIRDVRHPIKLAYNDTTCHALKVKDAWVGFDMEVGDWVSPFGKGSIADFEVRLTWDGLQLYETKLTRLDVRFTDELSGYYDFANVMSCDFDGAYEAADSHEWKRELACSSGRDDNGVWYKGVGGDKSIVVRCRVKVDEKGNVVSANYATIKALGVAGRPDGMVDVAIRYIYNPRPNDRNLEPERRKIPMYKVE